MKTTKKGFTVLEIIICIALVATFTVLFFFQKRDIDKMNRDEQRKTAINAMFYALEEGFYEENGCCRCESDGLKRCWC